MPDLLLCNNLPSLVDETSLREIINDDIEVAYLRLKQNRLVQAADNYEIIYTTLITYKKLDCVWLKETIYKIADIQALIYKNLGIDGQYIYYCAIKKKYKADYLKNRPSADALKVICSALEQSQTQARALTIVNYTDVSIGTYYNGVVAPSTSTWAQTQDYIRQERKREYIPPSVINSELDAVEGYQERVDFLSGVSSIQEQLNNQTKSIKELKIVGISGSGKTELAKAYARQYEARFVQPLSQAATSSSAPSEIVSMSSMHQPAMPLIYILDARHDNYLSHFEEFAEALDIDVDYHRKVCNPDASKDNGKKYESRLASKIFQALQDYPQWLIIMDVDADMQMISHFIPKKRGLIGTIIYMQEGTDLTQAELRHGKLPIPIIDLKDGLTDTEAVALLVSITGIPEDNQGSALALAAKLDRLPLALQVAARYITLDPNLKAVKTDDYQSYLKEYKKALVDLDERQKGICSSFNISSTQYTAIELSVKALPDKSKQLLRFCSLLAARDLPQDLLCDYTISFLDQSATTDIHNNMVFASLRRHGLLNLQSVNKKAWFIHQITHAYARSNILPEDNVKVVKPALKLLNDNKYDLPIHFKLLNQVYPHVASFIDYINQITLPIDLQLEIKLFLIKWGSRASLLGYQKKAIAWLIQARDIQVDVHAKDTVALQQQLGIAYGRMGCMAEEVRYLEQALALSESDSSMSEEQLIIHIDLGNVYSKLGDEERQRNHYTSAFHILKQRIQNEAFVAGIEINFAMNLIGSGFFDRVNTSAGVHIIFDELLACFSNENEYNLAKARMIIGNAYGRKGNIAQQEKLVKLALDYFEQHQDQYIVDYADALVSYSNALSEMGEPEQQLTRLSKAFDIQRQHCNENNHAIVITVLNMSCAYYDLEQHENAEAILIKEGHNRITASLLPYLITFVAKSYLHIKDKSNMARTLLLDSLALQKSHGDKIEDVPIFAETLLYLGIEAMHRNDLVEAQNYLYDALYYEYEYFQQQTILTARTLIHLSEINISLKIYDIAFEQVNDAMTILNDVLINKQHSLIKQCHEIYERIEEMVKTKYKNSTNTQAIFYEVKNQRKDEGHVKSLEYNR